MPLHRRPVGSAPEAKLTCGKTSTRIFTVASGPTPPFHTASCSRMWRLEARHYGADSSAYQLLTNALISCTDSAASKLNEAELMQ